LGLHAYCITGGLLPPPGLAGLTGIAVQALSSAGIAAWYSEHVRPPATGLDEVRAHDAVVRAALTDDGTPIPLRFGQWFAERADLRRQLEARREHWLRLLDRFAGTVEMGVRLCRPATPSIVVLAGGPAPGPAEPPLPLPEALWPSAASPPALQGAGRQYLERLRTGARAQEVALAAGDELPQLLRALTSGVVLAERCDAVPDREGQWRMAHLLRRVHMAAYQEAIGQLRRHHPDVRVLLTGPWPPYSFAADGD
jgi:hypothetical protein